MRVFLPHSLHTVSPSGKLNGFAANDGSVFVTGESVQLPMIAYETKTKSPKGLIFSPDDWNLVVFNDPELSILASEGHTFRDVPSYNAPPIEVFPPNGVTKITFSKDSKIIIVKGTDNKEVRYDLNGKEITQ